MRRWGALVAIGVVASSCGDDGPASACGPILREDLDPASAAHVLPNGPEPDYRSDPPTSGPHQPSPPQTGVLDEPLPRPVQVGILESGTVLVQFAPGVSAHEAESLASVAGDEVVVAPNPDLDHPVVLTAWTYKRTCDAVDLDAVREFVAARVGKGPGPD